MTEYTSQYGIKTNLTLNEINPMTNPEIAVSSVFLSLLKQRIQMKRYLTMKTRSLSLLSFLVDYACLYYVLFNGREIYNNYKNLR